MNRDSTKEPFAKCELVETWVWKYPSCLIGQGTYDRKQPDDISGYGRIMVLLREVTE